MASHVMSKLAYRNTDSDEFLLLDFPEASTIHVNQLAYYLRVADGGDSISTVLQKVLPEWTNADGILVNTIEELDKIGLIYFKRKFCRPNGQNGHLRWKFYLLSQYLHF